MDKNERDCRERWYAFEKLEVYRLAVRVKHLVKEIIAKFPNLSKEDVDQALRSSKSAVRNICEGSGEFRPREKARFYRMSIRSATETGGSLKLMEDDVGPDLLFDNAHDANYELIAKLINLHKGKRR